MKTIISRTPS